MALTTTSRFKSVTLLYPFASQLNSCRAILTDGTQVSIGLIAGEPASGTQAATDLGILQDIHASDDGFMDADGDAVTVTLSEGPVGLTLDDLEPNGFVNPLLAGSYDRIANLKAVRGALMKHATVVDDATSGRRDIQVSGGTNGISATAVLNVRI